MLSVLFIHLSNFVVSDLNFMLGLDIFVKHGFFCNYIIESLE